MNLQRDYPLSYVMGKDYMMIDERIKEYNRKNPAQAWFPSKIKDTIQLKDGVDIQLGMYNNFMKDEYSDYIQLINEYIEQYGGFKGLFGYDALTDADIDKIKSIISRAKDYAKKTLLADSEFAYRHRADIAKASKLIE